MKTINYKGYTGEYQLFDDGANGSTYYAGSIPGVKHHAVVLFEGESMEELVEDFHAAVEDCISNGYSMKEKSHRVSIPASLYSQLSVQASQNGLSVSRYLSRALASVLL